MKVFLRSVSSYKPDLRIVRAYSQYSMISFTYRKKTSHFVSMRNKISRFKYLVNFFVELWGKGHQTGSRFCWLRGVLRHRRSLSRDAICGQIFTKKNGNQAKGIYHEKTSNTKGLHADGIAHRDYHHQSSDRLYSEITRTSEQRPYNFHDLSGSFIPLIYNDFPQ